MQHSVKDTVRTHWNAEPCGTRGLPGNEGSVEWSREKERIRYSLEPFIHEYAEFGSWRGRDVLEIGCGGGTDTLQFARAGARVSAVDLTPHGVAVTREQLDNEGLSADLRVGDAETLPFADGSFDLVYSWGVLHHTPDTRRAINEAIRVCRPGGKLCIMLYHYRAIHTFMYWALFGLLRGHPFRSPRDILFHHKESLGTQAFTREEAARFFRALEEVDIETRMTPYDLPYVPRHWYAPRWLQRLFPDRFGFYMIIRAWKPGAPANAAASGAPLRVEP